jgi:hypothetical protein
MMMLQRMVLQNRGLGCQTAGEQEMHVKRMGLERQMKKGREKIDR